MNKLYTEEAARLNANEGFKARMAGRRREANPNERGTIMRDDWVDGYDAADNDPKTPPLNTYTKSQIAALLWLRNRGNEGVFNRNGVLMARGELAGVERSTWNILRDAHLIHMVKGKKGGARVTMTDEGEAECAAHSSLAEANTVEDDE